MANYESTFICSPELPAEKIEELLEKIKKIIHTAGGQLLMSQQLGRKRLAYPIKKHREGSYVYMELSGPNALVSALESFYLVNDPVIRYLTIKVEKKKAPPKPQEQAQASSQAQPAPEEVKTNEPGNQSPAPGAE